MGNAKKMGSIIIVEITHKSHPLCGQKGLLIKTRIGKDPKVRVRLIDGSELEIKRSWLNLQDTSAPNATGEVEYLLEASGLLEMAKKIKEIKNQNGIVENSPPFKRVKKAKGELKRLTE